MFTQFFTTFLQELNDILSPFSYVSEVTTPESGFRQQVKTSYKNRLPDHKVRLIEEKAIHRWRNRSFIFSLHSDSIHTTVASTLRGYK